MHYYFLANWALITSIPWMFVLSLLDYPPLSSCIRALVTVTGDIVESVTAGQRCGIVVERSNFYAQSGGQASDKGTIKVILKTQLCS